MWFRDPALDRWARFAVRRTRSLLVGVAVLVVGTFLFIHLLGGDPVRASLGLDAPPALVQLRRAQLHLDKPLLTQFRYYITGLARLDFGTSIKTGEPVSRVIKARILNTVGLAMVAMTGVVVFAITVGLWAGAVTRDGRHKLFEFTFGVGTGTLLAIPEFLMATLLVYLLAVRWQVLPVAGKAGASSFVLPATALGLTTAIFLARTIRVETTRVLSKDYMVTARSKHLPTHIFYGRHALRNVLTSALTVAGTAFGVMLGGSVVIENIFAWPGMGTAVIQAILDRDYPTAQAIVLMLGLLVLVVNTVVDLILALLEPRSLVAED